MRQTQQAPSNALIAVDAGIVVLERRLAQMGQIRGLSRPNSHG